MSAYTGDIVKDGLVLCLDAANGKSYPGTGTTWYDISRNGNNASLENGTTYNSGSKGHIVLDGTNDQLSITNNARLGGAVTSFVTISSWFRFNALPVSGEVAIIRLDNYWQLGFVAGGVIRCLVKTTGGTDGWTAANDTSYPFATNTWYNMTMVYNGSNLTIYVNSVPVKVATVTGTIASTSGGFVFMGRWTEYMNGNIANCQIYNRALSAAEIRENYNATKGRYDTTRSSDAIKPRLSTSGLVLHLDAANYRSFVSGSSTWRDLSGNGFDGTLTNGPTYSSTNNGFIVFDGTNDFVQCTGTIVTTTATFLVWMYRNGNQGQYDGVLFSRGTNTTGLNIFISNQLGYHWNDNGNTYNWNSGLTIPDLQWSLCAVSVSSTSATAYLCQQTGITSAVNNVSHASTTLNDIKIGQDDFGGRFFAGNISVAQIYNRALSRDEIVQYFNTTKVRYGYVL